MNFRGESLSDKSVLNNYVEDLQEDGEGGFGSRPTGNGASTTPLRAGSWMTPIPCSRNGAPRGHFPPSLSTKGRQYGSGWRTGASIPSGMARPQAYASHLGKGKRHGDNLRRRRDGVHHDRRHVDAHRPVGVEGAEIDESPGDCRRQRAIYLRGICRQDEKTRMICNDRIMLYDLNSGKWLNGHLPENGQAGVVKNVFQDKEGTIRIARDHQGWRRSLPETAAYVLRKWISKGPCPQQHRHQHFRGQLGHAMVWHV